MTVNVLRAAFAFLALHIHVADTSTLIRPTDTLYVHPDEVASFTCMVSWGNNRMHSIFWGRSGDGEVWTIIAECWGIDGTCVVVDKFDDTYSTYSISSRHDYFQLDVMKAALDDDGHFDCWLYSDEVPASPHARLIVLDPINHIVITCYEYDELVTVKENIPRVFTCESMCGNPAATLSWKIGDRDVTEYSHESSKESDEDSRQYDTGSTLLYAYNSTDDQKYLECSGFQHDELTVQSFRIILNVEHAPVIQGIVVNSWGADHMVEVECLASANPASITYYWKSSDGQTEEEGSKFWTVEDVEQDGQVTITCGASNRVGMTSWTETLHRRYSPEIDEIAVLGWSEDHQVEVECVADANPSDIVYSWKSDDGQTGGNSRTWQLTDTDQDKLVTVTCNASNVEGMTSHTEVLHGRSAPVIQEIAVLSWGEDYVVDVECVASARPDDITYAWRSASQAGGNTRIWRVEDVDRDGVVTVTCMASNVVGMAVKTDTLYKTYAPIIQEIILNSWSTDHMAEVECVAMAHPANITYSWSSIDGQIGGDSKTWTVEDVERNDQVTVTCEASNSEGATSMTETLHNLYPPIIHEIAVLSWDDDHVVKVECIATANPNNITYAWRSDSQAGGNTRIWKVEDVDKDGRVLVTCKAANEEGETVAMEEILREYAPVVHEVTVLSWMGNMVEVECHASANPDNITYTWISGGNQTGSGKVWLVEDVEGVGYVSLACEAENVIGSSQLMTTVYNPELNPSNDTKASSVPVSAVSISTTLVLLSLLAIFILLWRRAVKQKREIVRSHLSEAATTESDDRLIESTEENNPTAPSQPMTNASYDSDEEPVIY